MYSWLYFIRSDREYHELMGYLLEAGEEEVSGISYLVFDDDLKSRDGRTFLRISGFLIAVNFFSHDTIFKGNMVKKGLNSDSLVDLYEIECEGKDQVARGITITRKAERIIFDRDLESFLRKNNFKFKDGSTLTIPKVSLL